VAAWSACAATGPKATHLALPEGVDTDKIEASFKNGVLTVRLPKKPEAIKPEKKRCRG
jgi:HSP20 family molecular chaperone IbpA